MIKGYEMEELIKAQIKDAKNLVIFSGAGISIDSGIKPFRGPNGLYSIYHDRICEISWFKRNRERAVEIYNKEFYVNIEPNRAHELITKLNPKAIITTNIDTLHEKAGSSNVIHYHGTLGYAVCLNPRCTYRAPMDKLSNDPCPQCGGMLKPDVVLFGEQINADIAGEALHWAETADVMIVVGASGVVYPACDLVHDAQKNGCIIIEINPEETPYNADFTFRENAIDALSRLC
jgi:NAD-dependent deacetylase